MGMLDWYILCLHRCHLLLSLAYHSKLDLVEIFLQCQHKQNKACKGSMGMGVAGWRGVWWLTNDVETEAADAMVAIEDHYHVLQCNTHINHSCMYIHTMAAVYTST